MFKFVDNLLSKEKIVGFLFIAPTFLGTVLLTIFPSIFSFFLSFTKWNLISPPSFCGLKNYLNILYNPIFYKVLWNTLFYSVSISIFGVIIPLLLAVIIDKKIKGANAFKTLYFLPYITPMIIIAIVWEWLLDP